MNAANASATSRMTGIIAINEPIFIKITHAVQNLFILIACFLVSPEWVAEKIAPCVFLLALKYLQHYLFFKP